MSVGAPELLYETEAVAEEGLETTAQDGAVRFQPQPVWRRLLADRVAIISAAFVLLVVLIAIFAPLIVKGVGAAGPSAVDPSAHDRFGLPAGPSHNALWPFIVALVGAALAAVSRLVPSPTVRRYGPPALLAVALLAAIGLAIDFWPSASHIFGVDREFRDLFSRVLYGARESLEVAAVAAAVSVIIGVTLGLLAGYFRGWMEVVISRLADAVQAFPALLLALGIGAACKIGNGCLGGLLRPGRTVVIVVIAVVSLPYIVRLVRNQALALRKSEFVQATLSLGTSNGRVITGEILPNVLATTVICLPAIIAQNVLLGAALSYLGVGVQLPQASWGAMLGDATSVFYTAWWYMLFPGLALLFTALAFYVLGDGLHDAVDPRLSPDAR